MPPSTMPDWVVQMIQKQQDILDAIDTGNINSKLDQICDRLEDHDHFINGNGQRSARETLGIIEGSLRLIEASIEQIKARLLSLEERNTHKDQTEVIEWWKWAAGLFGAAVVGLLIWLVQMHIH